jgi:hypothetical protein
MALLSNAFYALSMRLFCPIRNDDTVDLVTAGDSLEVVERVMVELRGITSKSLSSKAFHGVVVTSRPLNLLRNRPHN